VVNKSTLNIKIHISYYYYCSIIVVIIIIIIFKIFLVLLLCILSDSHFTVRWFWLCSEAQLWEHCEKVNLKQSSKYNISILVHAVQLEASLDLAGI